MRGRQSVCEASGCSHWASKWDWGALVPFSGRQQPASVTVTATWHWFWLQPRQGTFMFSPTLLPTGPLRPAALFTAEEAAGTQRPF